MPVGTQGARVPPLVSCAAAAPVQHAPMAWRWCARAHVSPDGLSVRLPCLPRTGAWSTRPHDPPRARPPLLCTHAYRQDDGVSHQRSGEVWRLTIGRSALELDNQVVQPRGRAGEDAQTGRPTSRSSGPMHDPSVAGDNSMARFEETYVNAIRTLLTQYKAQVCTCERDTGIPVQARPQKHDPPQDFPV